MSKRTQIGTGKFELSELPDALDALLAEFTGASYEVRQKAVQKGAELFIENFPFVLGIDVKAVIHTDGNDKAFAEPFAELSGESHTAFGIYSMFISTHKRMACHTLSHPFGVGIGEFSTGCGKRCGKFTTIHLKAVTFHHFNDIIHQSPANCNL